MAGKKRTNSADRVQASMESDDYEVGYKKPPKHTQFKKGVSGNPRGRKEGSLGLGATLSKVFEQKLRVTVDGKTSFMPTMEAMARQLARSAYKGDLKALKLAYDLLERYKAVEPQGNSQLEALFQALKDGSADTRQ